VPLPQDHLRRLDRCLAWHEEALAEIRAGDGDEEDALLHETLLVIGRDPYVLWALDELARDPSLAVRFEAPAYFNRFGVPMPADADVRFVHADRSVRVEATFDHGPHHYSVTWDRSVGFAVDRGVTRRRTA
jgi:hypothetical protein